MNDQVEKTHGMVDRHLCTETIEDYINLIGYFLSRFKSFYISRYTISEFVGTHWQLKPNLERSAGILYVGVAFLFA